MNYVAGAISKDGVLGRTFAVETEDQAKACIKILVTENRDEEFDVDVFDSSCAYTTKLGHYFIGLLEDLSE